MSIIGPGYMFERLLNIQLPQGQSAFLWGARQTGKSTYLKQRFPNAKRIDLLQSDVFLGLSKDPHLLRERILAYSPQDLAEPIIIDEIQKIPQLLDEVHWLIENTSAQFILCGSSARKLRRSGVNLLGGRSWRYHFFPLVTPEVPNFDLQHALNAGMLPVHYMSKHPFKSLQAYVEDYLTQEIKEEGLVRNLPSFARFLESLAFCHGDLVNYTHIARDCGVDAKTVQNYFQILVDTLLGYYVPPYSKKIKRDIISQMPKFYLADVGITNYLIEREIKSLKGASAGDAFEHFILMELKAYQGLYDKRFTIYYWRTKNGLEVDFILGKASVAIEVKISTRVHKTDIKGLLTFCQEHQPDKGLVVCQEPEPRRINLNADSTPIEVLPWSIFLERLWQGHII